MCFLKNFKKYFLFGLFIVVSMASGANAALETSTGWVIKSVGITSDTGSSASYPFNTIYVEVAAGPATACADANTCGCTNTALAVLGQGAPHAFKLQYAANNPFVPLKDKDIWKMLWTQLNTAISLGRSVDLTFSNASFCQISAVTMHDS